MNEIKKKRRNKIIRMNEKKLSVLPTEFFFFRFLLPQIFVSVLFCGNAWMEYSIEIVFFKLKN